MSATHLCGKCGRRLKVDRYVFSRFTKNRYCWPGEGCQKRGKDNVNR